jgi:hypothetical protein
MSRGEPGLVIADFAVLPTSPPSTAPRPASPRTTRVPVHQVQAALYLRHLRHTLTNLQRASPDVASLGYELLTSKLDGSIRLDDDGGARELRLHLLTGERSNVRGGVLQVLDDCPGAVEADGREGFAIISIQNPPEGSWKEWWMQRETDL